jgi:hypothetical protein
VGQTSTASGNGATALGQGAVASGRHPRPWVRARPRAGMDRLR